MSSIENNALSFALFATCVSKIVGMSLPPGDDPSATLPWSAYTSALLSYASTGMVQTTISCARAVERRAKQRASAVVAAPAPRQTLFPIQEYVYVSAALEARDATVNECSVVFDLVKVAESIDCRYVPRASRCAYIDLQHCTIALHPDGSIHARQCGGDEGAARFAIDCVKRTLERRVARCGVFAPNEGGIVYKNGPVIVTRQFRYDFQDAIDLEAFDQKLCSTLLRTRRSSRRLDVRLRSFACLFQIHIHHITCKAANMANVVKCFDLYIRPALAYR